MKAITFRAINILVAVLMALSMAVLPGCFGGGSGEARDSVDEAKIIIGESQPLIEDLLNLDNRINTLGTRFTKSEDTSTEGKSLAAMALIDVDELESRFSQARELLSSVTNMDNAGHYTEYARLALEAVEKELRALAANRELLTAVSDMFDVLPLAQNQEQLSYYINEIDRLTEEVSKLLGEGVEAAAAADAYFMEHDL
jgi:hypothetical protein